MITTGVKLKLLGFVILTLFGVSYVAAKYVGVGATWFGAKPCTVTADFPDSGGIFTNAEVTYRGVGVGTVGRLTLLSDGVRVDLDLSDCGSPRIPADTIAIVSDRSAVGEQYVELEPAKSGGPYLSDGSNLPMSGNRVPVATEVLLTNLDRLVNSLDTANLAITVDELGKVFSGRGPALQTLIDSGNQLLQRASDALPQTVALINEGQIVLQTQLDEGSAIKSWAASLNLLTQQLKASDADLRRLLTVGPTALSTITDLVRQNSSDLGVLFANLVTVNEVVVKHIGGLEQILILYPAVLAGGFTVLPGDGTAHFGLVVNFDDPPTCVAGYGGTNKRLPSDTSDAPVNTAAQCAQPGGSVTDVRGAQNVPGGDPVYTGGSSGASIAPSVSSTTSAPSSTSSTQAAALLGDRSWMPLLTKGVGG
jgi:phospholipid/cholesterol/gamma-HCH transport system substrate-binding protein